ncbi:MAG: histidine kinase [Flavitalea sp.]
MKDWYNNRVVQILFHLLAWGIFLSLPALLRPDFQNAENHIVRPPLFTVENLVTHGFLIILFYLNAYYLIPKFLNRKKMIRYVISILIIFTATFFVTFWAKTIQEKRIYNFVRSMPESEKFDHPPFPPYHHPMHGPGFHVPFIFTLFAVIFVLAVSTAYRFILDKLRSEQLQQLRRNEHLKTELTFLRSQISPHFIFNVLNSAVSLARVNSDQLEPTLLKLSNLMRYMLYNADDDKVPLSQEIEYLESYIDLQRIRFEEDINITFTNNGNYFGYAIEPMLLIPFVENAFKHGIGRITQPGIFIDLKLDHNTLHFQVKNKFDASMVTVNNKDSGIGLANVKKRLSLLYDDKYSLKVNILEDWFEVYLKLTLK